MTSLLLITVFLAITRSIYSTSDSVFLSNGENFTVIEGDDVDLECQVNLSKKHQKVIWQNGTAVMSYDRIVAVPGDRILLTVTDNLYSLKIKSVSIWDEGRYNCQVTGNPAENQANWITVHIPPTIQEFIPSDDVITLLENDELLLICVANGIPSPSVTWRRSLIPWRQADGHQKSTKEKGQRYHINHIDRSDAGTYECEASNGIRELVRKTIVVHVEFAPQVAVGDTPIYTGPGHHVNIECSFQANPPVSVTWMHNDTNLQDNHNTRPNIKQSKERSDIYDKYFLIISDVRPYDLGLYSCIGTNEIGTISGDILLSPNPYKLTVTSSTIGRYSDRYTLTWTCSSHSKLIDFTLALKQVNDSIDTPWHNISIPFYSRDYDNDVVITQAHTFDGLEPSGNYSLVMKARNEYSSTKWTTTFYFTTASMNIIEEVELDSNTGEIDWFVTSAASPTGAACVHRKDMLLVLLAACYVLLRLNHSE